MLLATTVAATSFDWAWQSAVWVYAASQTAVYLLFFGYVIRSSGDLHRRDIHKEGI
jgi:hypothetical protein